MRKIYVLLLLVLISIVSVGCGQQQAATTVGGDYTKASTDLKNVATGIQSTGGNASLGVSAGGDSAAQSLSIKNSSAAAQAIPAGWDASKTLSFESSYTWTTTTGATVTDEVEMYMRFLGDSGNQLSLDNLVLAKKLETVQNFSSPQYSGYLHMLMDMPTTFALPLTMNMTADGYVTYPGTTVSTFEITSLSLSITITNTSGGGSATGSMGWGYLAPGSTYAYYYGTISINLASLGADPSAMTGDVYQDLTNDGAKNGVKVGTISIGSQGGVVITLDDGTKIYAGVF